MAARDETSPDFGIGESRPGVPMTPATVVELAPATKAVTCSTAALLWRHGLFDLDDPVCRNIPEFANAGKQTVTIRHLRTHMGGLSDPWTTCCRSRRPWPRSAAVADRTPGGA